MKRDRWVLLLIAVLVGALLPLAPGSGAGGSERDGRAFRSQRSDKSKAEILAYWTDRRMREAKPLPLRVVQRPGSRGSDRDDRGTPTTVEPYRLATAEAPTTSQSAAPGFPFTPFEVTDTTAAPQRAIGKIFFTNPADGGTYVCSGAVVASPTNNFVWTAGHCVHGGGPGQSFMTNVLFVPGRKDGASPFGMWTYDKVFAPSSWVTTPDGNLDQDFGLISLNNGGTSNQPVADVVGSFGIKFNQPVNQAYKSYGYPANPADGFDGEKMLGCNASSAQSDPLGSWFPAGPTPIGIGCHMTGGSSGGPWLFGDQFIESNNSYGYPGNPDFEDVMFGPYLGNVAMNFYDNVTAGTPLEAIKLTKVSVKPNPFKPRGKKVVRLLFTTNLTATIRLNIKNKKGKTILKVPPATLDANSWAFSWNGRNKKGKIVPKGKYFFNLSATADGKTAKAKKAFKIKR